MYIKYPKCICNIPNVYVISPIYIHVLVCLFTYTMCVFYPLGECLHHKHCTPFSTFY